MIVVLKVDCRDSDTAGSLGTAHGLLVDRIAEFIVCSRFLQI